jgi:hypothetical protein
VPDAIGPFYFAWVDAEETTFGEEHHVYDEYIFEFNREWTEGECATLTVVIKNPFTRLLGPARKKWAWFSWDDGTEIVPLFFGRLVAVPTDLFSETLELSFVARPRDTRAQKEAIVEGLKVRPFWDPIFISVESRDDPEAVLDGYSLRWHFDPVTHEVTVSDVLDGEDGVEEFNSATDSYPYADVKYRLASIPLRHVDMDANVGWTQKYDGTIPIPPVELKGPTAGSVASAWPKQLQTFSGGWSTADSHSGLGDNGKKRGHTGGFRWEYKYDRDPNPGELKTHEGSWTNWGPGDAGSHTRVTTNVQRDEEGKLLSQNSQSNRSFTVGSEEGMYADLLLKYEAARQRTERVVFRMTASLQEATTDDDEEDGSEDVEKITLSGSDVDKPLNETSPGDVPIVDVSRRAYFPTDRGLWSLEYLVCVARSTLIIRSRAVEVEFGCEFRRAVGVSCRMNASIEDRRLPGGSALGKITSITLTGNGDTGLFEGHLKLGCAIGTGGSPSVSEGINVYVEDGYVEDGYQALEDQTVVIGTSGLGADVGYSVPIDDVNDDGLIFPLTYAQVVVFAGLVGSEEESRIKEAEIADSLPEPPNPEGPPVTLNAINYEWGWFQKNLEQFDAYAEAVSKIEGPWYELELKPVNNGPFNVQYDIDLTMLYPPMMVDLTE